MTARHMAVALVAGLGLGIGGGAAPARHLSQLYGIEATSGSTMAGAAVVLAALALTASAVVVASLSAWIRAHAAGVA